MPLQVLASCPWSPQVLQRLAAACSGEAFGGALERQGTATALASVRAAGERNTTHALHQIVQLYVAADAEVYVLGCIRVRVWWLWLGVWHRAGRRVGPSATI